MNERELRAKSVSLILESQSSTGAWMACSSFGSYRYSWFRDGSFIAYAMLGASRPDSCRRFLLWAAKVLVRNADTVDAVEAAVSAGRGLPPEAFLPTRFTLEGEACNDDWPNHQIDGYGAWLWCLDRYVEATGDRAVLAECRAGIDLAVRYLAATWRLPCYDCWEENPGDVHPSTLACVHGGLASIGAVLGGDEAAVHDRASREAELVRGHVLAHTASYGGFPKSIGRQDVDASLLWLAVPFGLVSPGDPQMRATVRQIEATLLEKGGVKRYARDTYFGGGQWILLTAWLGWYHAVTGDRARAAERLDWVMRQADAEGNLPEQTLAITNDPSFIAPWEKKWGTVASPLLWSHAMFLVLSGALGAGRGTLNQGS
jgi:GH15 family glucan-1,4-alpha-glucosidase